MASEDHMAALLAVARMYYEEDKSQADIARLMDKSRPTISRMLTAAREMGIVEIHIRVPFVRATEMERALTERLGLADCRVVVAPRGQIDSVDHLGRAAAEYLQQVLEDGMTVGVSNGRTLASTAKYLEPKRSLHLEVVQIIGAMGGDNPRIDGPDIARQLALAYDARCHYLHIPLLVEDESTRRALRQDRHVSRTLKLGAHADVALLGVGTLDPQDRSPLLSGFLTQRQVEEIGRAGGVGHICAQHFSAAGERLALAVNEMAMGISLAQLRRVRRVIAVAGGVTKAPAIVASIRGGFVNTLVTDDRAAARMLDLVDAGAPGI